MNDPRFEIFEGKDNAVDGVGSGAFKARKGEWYWRLRAANGEIVASGEGYTRREDVRRGVVSTAQTVVDIALANPARSAAPGHELDADCLAIIDVDE